MLYKSLFILGRQPALGRAELESVLGAEHLQPAGESAMAADVEPGDGHFGRLGGGIRLAEVLDVVETVQWPAVAKALATSFAQQLAARPAGKVKLGLSCFGLTADARQLLRTG